MFNDLTKAPPTFNAIQDKRKYKYRVENVMLCIQVLAAVVTATTTVIVGWNPFVLLGGACLVMVGFGLYWKLRKNRDLDEMPSRLTTHMKVFAKASSPSAHYYLQVRHQDRQFITAEFNLLEREFKRASSMREQDLKSGNKRLFPPLPSTLGIETLALATNSTEAGEQLVAGFPASD